MKTDKILFKVKYTGNNRTHFTNGNVYNVYKVDEDGDYLVMDDFMDLILEYKSKFEVITE